MKEKQFIDSHKLATGPAVLAMMAAWHQWSNPTAWLYLALHGTYGVLWVVKSRVFPDRSWERRTGWGWALVIWGGLTLYWIAPWLLMSRGVQAPGWYAALAVTLYAVGIFLHFSADMQKHTALNLRPGVLITDGLLAWSRNVNYFGELLIYTSFALLARHWLPFAVLALFVLLYWVPSMLRKERSLSRYRDFAEYRRRTAAFIPFFG